MISTHYCRQKCTNQALRKMILPRIDCDLVLSGDDMAPGPSPSSWLFRAETA